jgi:hypothetical protein
MTPEKVAATETLLESFGCSIIDAEQRLITCPGKILAYHSKRRCGLQGIPQR